MMNIPKWKEDLQSNLVAAAAGMNSGAVLRWIMRCWADHVKIQELFDSKGFEQLDQILSYGMIKMIGSRHQGSSLAC